jgi:hypothetical protein
MKTPTPLKIITILAFILLIVVFIFYRSGAFSDGNLNQAKTVDTIPSAFRDSVLSAYRQQHMMSGSKSGMVVPKDDHPALKAMVDSLWRQRMQQMKKQ